MDAREQLRRYLEQRRELGESELVLDGMTVDEVLAIIVGKTGARTRDTDAAGPLPQSRGESADWRAALRAAASSDAPRQAPHVEREVSRGETTPAADRAPPGISVGTPAGELFGGPLATLDSLQAIAARVATCTRCTLYSTALNAVPGEGSPNAEMMLVGEAPGATEDETGRPFVGAAGQLLTKILAAIQLAREDVFICNVLKHRPPGNRNPRPEEVVACSPYLVRQIEVIRPKVIIALGTFAAQTLLDTKLSIGKLRGQIHRYYGVPLIVTYHPAALLRNPSWKRPTWQDVQLARRILDSAAAGA